MLSWEKGGSADYVLQELYRQVLQVRVAFEVLAVLGDPVPQDGEHPHCGGAGGDGHLPFG